MHNSLGALDLPVLPQTPWDTVIATVASLWKIVVVAVIFAQVFNFKAIYCRINSELYLKYDFSHVMFSMIYLIIIIFRKQTALYCLFHGQP